jgi:1-acyl-sn-glycerol-3-phosphate acyltransferase
VEAGGVLLTGIRVALQSMALLAITLVFVTIPLTARILTLNAAIPVARVGSWASHRWCRLLCRVLRLHVSTAGRPEGVPFVIAANHLSYLDILVLGSHYPCQFVAKREIRSWPLFGWISRAAGTLFVDRESARDAVRAVRQMRHLLRNGISLTLFPEGRISNGESVQPFLPALLEPAADAGVPCFGASLSYETPGAELPPARTICWHDSANFITHIIRVMSLPRIEVKVSFSPSPIRDKDRKELARKLREHVVSFHVPIRDRPRAEPCAR